MLSPSSDADFGTRGPHFRIRSFFFAIFFSFISYIDVITAAIKFLSVALSVRYPAPLLEQKDILAFSTVTLNKVINLSVLQFPYL